MMETEVLVVGAGPTGLMLALWLARLGVRVRIVDETDGPGTTSRALVLHARSLEFYAQLGIAEQAIAHGRKFAGARLWAHGDCRGRIELGDIGLGLSAFPFMLILPQDEQERLLVDALGSLGVEVERGTALASFDDRDGRVLAHLNRRDGVEDPCECAYVAGCDGVHSAVRHRLEVEFRGDAYAHLFYVADVDARGSLLNGDLNLALDTSDFLAVFPLPGETRARLIGTIEREAEDRNRQALAWEDVSPAILQHLPLEIDRVNWFSTYHVHHRVASRFRVGRAFVLGDAAHVHSPVGGQGMNTGLGDAVNLAWKLAMVLRRGAADGLLDTYEVERMGFARRLVATTDRAFTFVTRDGALARIVREDVVPRLLLELMKTDAARRYLFRTVSQIAIEYRDSPLSAGHAGEVHGGDRLPWTNDNYACLSTLAWQVHLYGQPPEVLAQACSDLRLPLHAFAGTASAALPESGTLYVVRPDGYVALASTTPDIAALRGYFAERQLRAA